ncbi:MAG TPA: 16S rRNA (cytosine(967)-C(5))-methyltransferase RsmB [Gemmatimonas sp.]
MPPQHGKRATKGKGPGTAITPSRSAAAGILGDVHAGHLLDQSFERRTTTLDARDRRWVQELVWGVLRHRERIDAILASRIRGGLSVLDDAVLDVLRLGTHQLLSMDSVPPYAAIGQSVEAVKRKHGIGAAKLVNAVLRRVDRERASIEPTLPADPVEALALTHSHPAWVVGRWAARFGLDHTASLLALNNTPAPVVVRPHGVSAAMLADSLTQSDVSTRDVPMVPESLEITGPVALTEVEAFRRGQFYVQDPAASLVAQYAHVAEGSAVADLCAAPGSKALELARRAGTVIAADRSEARVERMRSGFDRLGVDTTSPARTMITMVADATAPTIDPVDAVLVDVPCTGTGTFRRHPDARWRLQASDFAVLGTLQRQILHAAAGVVRAGGLLIYSTCSLEPEENDDVVDAFLASHPDFVVEPPPTGVVSDAVIDRGRLRVLPQQHGFDGAFAVRLRRNAGSA